ncbi:MAG TPA: SDR family oxidoreductase [Marmoricola sp.]|nr:SDR family oxidoreductase [Marmoricola sp.]
MQLAEKVAIVTGGAGGIGRGIVRAFAKEGARIVAVDVNDAAGRALEEELGDAVRFAHVDLTDQHAAERIRDAALTEFSRIDVLVNNAHASRQAPLATLSQADLDLSFDTGFRPTLRLMQACYEQLREHRGSVINFASGAGMDGMPNQGAYAAAKEAIRAISRVAANEWATEGINVNVISPLALTEGIAAYLEANPDKEAALLSATPMRRFGDPEADVGRVAVFLASGDASYITGQTIMVDGGAVKLR